MGGGFLYTNETTLSLGLVCGLHHLKDAKIGSRKCWKISQTASGSCAAADRRWQAGEIMPHVKIPRGGNEYAAETGGRWRTDYRGCRHVANPRLRTHPWYDLAISAGEAAAKTALAMKRDDFSKAIAEYRQHLDEGPMRDAHVS